MGGKQLIKGLVNVKSTDEILDRQKRAVDNFLFENKVSKDVEVVLNKAKTGLLNIKDTEKLLNMEKSGAAPARNGAQRK